MIKTQLLFLAILIPLINGMALADAIAPVTDPIADWSVVQAAGGISVESGVAQGNNTTWKVPMNCDMATTAPGTLIEKTIVRQDSGNIFISLVLTHTVWTLTPERSRCRPFMVDAKEGMHGVFYQDAAGKFYPIANIKFTPIGRGPGG